MKRKNEEMLFHFKSLRHTDLGKLKYHVLLNSFPPNPKFFCAYSFLAIDIGDRKGPYTLS